MNRSGVLVHFIYPAHPLSALLETVKTCGAEVLLMLGQMKQQDHLAAADSTKLRVALEAILATAEVCAFTLNMCSPLLLHDVEAPSPRPLFQKLRPRGLELQQGELGDLVEQEMAATSAAVESAASRIEVNSRPPPNDALRAFISPLG